MKRKKDRKSGDRKSLQYRGTKCLNCEQPLDVSDVYCPYCSQLNSNKQLSAKDFFSEFINSIVVFDSRLRITLKDLLFRPGIITRNYVKGQRLKYANPFRFFLSVSIIYFLLNSLIQIIQPSSEVDQLDLNNSSSDMIVLDSLRKSFPATPSKDFMASDSLKKEEPKKAFEFISEEALDTMSFIKSYTKRFSLYNQYYEKTKIKSPVVALDNLHHQNTAFNRWVYSKNATVEKIDEKPSEFINYVISKIPFFLFFFTPFFALFFWLIYSRSKYTYIEHTIFIFHIFSFIFVSMLIAIVPNLIFGSEILYGILFMIIGPIYFYKALRNFYRQSRVITLIKFVFLNIVFAIGLTFAALIFVAATAAVY